MKLTIPFGKFLPDQASFRNPGVISARNVVPLISSYGPFRDLSVFSNAISAQALGGVFSRNNADTAFMYAGDATKLYELVNTTWTDQSKGGGYTVASDDVWEFAVWNRNSKIIATDYTDAVQSMTIGLGASSAFADMITGTNKPKAKHVGIVNQFVVLGNTNDSVDGQRQTRLWWSAFGNEANFDPDASTQSDYEDLPSGGKVQRVLGLTNYGLVFQNDMVRTMQYVGGGVIFEILPINYAPGTPIPNSVVSHKNMVFYIAEDGFFAIDGASVQPIGNSEIDRFFWSSFDITHRRDLSAAIDPDRKLVCWAYAANSESSSLASRILMFNYAEGKWSYADIDTEFLLRAETTGYTLDGLDTLGSDIDNATVFNVSLDSDRWKGPAIRFGAFDRDHKLAYFIGATLAGSIETGDIQPQDGARWQLDKVRPLIDGGNTDITVASRTKLQDAVSYGSPSEMDYDGACHFRSEGRYQRIRTSVTSSLSWSHLQGLQIEFEIGGER